MSKEHWESDVQRPLFRVSLSCVADSLHAIHHSHAEINHLIQSRVVLCHKKKRKREINRLNARSPSRERKVDLPGKEIDAGIFCVNRSDVQCSAVVQ